MAETSKRTRVGDVFIVPIDDERAAVGQVVASIRPNPLFVAVFERVVSREEGSSKVPDALASPILLLSNTMDAFIKSGKWPKAGSRPVDHARIPLPYYKVSRSSPDDIWVINYEGEIEREASPEERRDLRFRSTFSPGVVDSALKAHHGIGKWIPEFNDLLYSNVERWSKGRRCAA